MKLLYMIYNFFLKFYNYIIKYNYIEYNYIKCKKIEYNYIESKKIDLLNPIIIILDNGNTEEYFSIIV